MYNKKKKDSRNTSSVPFPPNFPPMGAILYFYTMTNVVISRDGSATRVLIPHIMVTMLSPGGGPYVSFILFSTLASRFLWTSIEVVREEKFTFSNICRVIQMCTCNSVSL